MRGSACRVFYQPPEAAQPRYAAAMAQYSSVLITGAPSGIGAALALELARAGVTLHLSGRDAGRLAATVAACRTRGAMVRESVLDVTDAAAMAAWVAGAGRLDLVIANAGVTGRGTDDAPDPAPRTRAVFATNLDGMLNTVLPALAVMRHQPVGADGWRGHIAVIASIAAFVAGSSAAAYCASKAAADSWTVATGLAMRRDRVALTSVCPGYIRTPMTADITSPKPGLMDADRAARRILRGIAAARLRIVFPWWMGVAARVGALIPPAWLAPITTRLPNKGGQRQG